MNRTPVLLLAAVLLLAGVLLFWLADGFMGIDPVPSEPSLEQVDLPPSPLAPAGVEGGGEHSGDPDRRLLEPPAPPEPALPEPVPSLLEGWVRDSAGKGLSGIDLEVIPVKVALEKEFFFLRRSLEQLHQSYTNLQNAAGGSFESQAGRELLSVQVSIQMVDGHAQRLGWKPVASCRTDAQGRYRIDPVRIPGGGTALFLVVSPLAILRARGQRPLLPDPVRLEERHLGQGRGPELVLHAGSRIDGIVAGMDSLHEDILVLAWQLGEKAALDRRRIQVKGTNGFLLDGLRPGVWRLALLRLGGNPAFSWGPILRLGESQALDGVQLVFSSSAALEVELLGPDRMPLELACDVALHLVGLGPPGEEGSECKVDEALFPATTTPGEPWRVEGLVPGRYKIRGSLAQTFAILCHSASKPGRKPVLFAPIEREVELAQGHKRVELLFDKLPPLTDVELQVRDPSGAPLAEGIASLIPVSKFGSGASPRNSRIVPGGTARFRNTLPLAYTLTVRARGFIEQQEALDLTDELGGGLVRREFILARGGTIAGRLLDPEGVGIPQARIVAEAEAAGTKSAFGSRTAATTDEQGAFKIEGLGPGRWTLVHRPKSGPDVRLVVELEEEAVKEVELRL